MLKRIGAEESGEFKAIASGTLPSGKPVVVNANGTVSVVSSSTFTQAVGSAAVFESATIQDPQAAFDTVNNKILIVYGDDGNSIYGTAVVGTIDTSDNSISFGTPVVFNSASTSNIDVAFSPDNSKFLLVYEDTVGRAIVATVSGTTVSFGSETTFANVNVRDTRVAFNEASGGVGFFVIAYRDDDNSSHGKAVVVSILANGSPNVYTPATFNSGETSQISLAYDSTNQRTVISYKDDANSNVGTAIVATRSTGSLSFGSEVVFNNAATQFTATVYDSTNGKIVIGYQDFGNSSKGTAVVGTVSGTAISFGSEVVFNTGGTSSITGDFDIDGGKVIFGYADTGNSNQGTFVVGTVSGTSISFSSEVVFEAAAVNTYDVITTYCSTIGKIVFAYRDNDNSNYGTAIVLQNAYTFNNITSENYIGMSRGVAVQTGDAASTGAETVFEAADSPYVSSVYDANAQKVVIVYNDSGDSSKGKGIVGTVSGTSISFGSPTSFHTGADDMHIAYDSVSQKVVIAFRDSNQPIPCRAVVGTVSGTSISFGSTVIFDSIYSIIYGIAYDSNAQRIVIGYRRQQSTNSTYGHTIVGTVSGTSISFGTPVVVNSASTSDVAPVYDPNAQKVVVSYTDFGDSEKGKAKVGTVSGTTISYGSAVVWNNGTTEKGTPLYYAPSQKIIIAFKDAGNSGYGTAIIGTVSGDSISFGSESVFESAAAEYFGLAYDSNAGKVIIAYRDQGNSNYGNLVVGTVSGTDITFDAPTVFNAANSAYMQATYDTNAQKTVVSFRDSGNSGHGTSFTFSPSTIATTRGEVASGQAASMDIIGSVSDNQIGLTAGQQYFVQTDGTIGTTAATPSVLAGTAISATELLVKT